MKSPLFETNQRECCSEETHRLAENNTIGPVALQEVQPELENIVAQLQQILSERGTRVVGPETVLINSELQASVVN